MLLDLTMEQSVPVVAQPSYQKRRSGEGEGREVRGGERGERVGEGEVKKVRVRERRKSK